MSSLVDILITINENPKLTQEQLVDKLMSDCNMSKTDAEYWAEMVIDLDNETAIIQPENVGAPKNNTEPDHETKRIIEPEMKNMTLEDVKDINEQDPHIVKWKGNTVPRDQYTSVIDPNQPYDERHDAGHEFQSDL